MGLKRSCLREVSLGCCLLSLFAGCQPSRVWRYDPEPPSGGTPASKYSLVVLPFVDQRGDDNADLRDLALIPLVPYGQIHYDRPEGKVGAGPRDPFIFDPSNDLREAVAKEIGNAGLFKGVRLGSHAEQGELALSGDITATTYQFADTYFGLSLLGAIFSLFLPNMKVANDLGLDLRLTDPSSGATLWSYAIKEDESHIYWIYQGRQEFMWDKLLKRGMKQAMPSLSARVPR